jgi:hypothetical protein
MTNQESVFLEILDNEKMIVWAPIHLLNNEIEDQLIGRQSLVNNGFDIRYSKNISSMPKPPVNHYVGYEIYRL